MAHRVSRLPTDISCRSNGSRDLTRTCSGRRPIAYQLASRQSSGRHVLTPPLATTSGDRTVDRSKNTSKQAISNTGFVKPTGNQRHVRQETQLKNNQFRGRSNQKQSRHQKANRAQKRPLVYRTSDNLLSRRRDHGEIGSDTQPKARPKTAGVHDRTVSRFTNSTSHAHAGPHTRSQLTTLTRPRLVAYLTTGGSLVRSVDVDHTQRPPYASTVDNSCPLRAQTALQVTAPIQSRSVTG